MWGWSWLAVMNHHYWWNLQYSFLLTFHGHHQVAGGQWGINLWANCNNMFEFWTSHRMEISLTSRQLVSVDLVLPEISHPSFSWNRFKSWWFFAPEEDHMVWLNLEISLAPQATWLIIISFEISSLVHYALKTLQWDFHSSPPLPLFFPDQPQFLFCEPSIRFRSFCL